MKAFIHIILLGLLLTTLISCDNSKTPFAGFQIGMSEQQVDSVALERKLKHGEWDKPNEVRYSNGVEMFGQTWKTLICVFENGKLSHFLLSHSTKPQGGDDSVSRNLSSSFFSDFQPRFSSFLNHPYYDKNDVVGNKEYIVRIYDSGDNTSLQVYPYSEENKNILLASHYQVQIDRQLEKLTKAMYNWINENNYVIKASYADDVRSANDYLKQNREYMTTSQLECFKRLNSIESR